MTVEADHVVVEGYTLDRPTAPGIEITGHDITVENNTVTRPPGGDGLRFFGTDLKILHNTILRTSNRYGHADCMQTFADDTPPSRRVLIEGNRCEGIDNMCLMAESPHDGEGDGHGHSSDLTIRDNYCETLKASRTLMFEDVQHATVTGNTFGAAIGLAIHSTGAHVSGNKASPRIHYEVGIDASSRPGCTGPRPGGAP
ncbi:right-handed parallel beta-helix repeat-containing protein [Streptomyces sp. NPDC007901]|uniref:right-handed parallel beta-helix repeat-containing protein n=1 Tax=Streptomyces sp. NPDC007901 TaxID=3364785 RepID=UPI0036EE4907